MVFWTQALVEVGDAFLLSPCRRQSEGVGVLNLNGMVLWNLSPSTILQTLPNPTDHCRRRPCD